MSWTRLALNRGSEHAMLMHRSQHAIALVVHRLLSTRNDGSPSRSSDPDRHVLQAEADPSHRPDKKA